MLIGIIVFLFIRQKKKKQEEAELQALLEEEERQRKQQQESDELEDLDFLMLKRIKMKRQIEMFIEQDPEAVVQLLNWLNVDRKENMATRKYSGREKGSNSFNCFRS